jgi:RND superfamily putative drug exporter
MFEALGRVMYRRRRWVVALALAVVAFAGVWGTGVFGQLTGGGFEDPDSESTRAGEVATAALGRPGTDVIVLYRSDDLTVDDPQYRAAVTESLDALPDSVVEAAVTFWSTQAPNLVSADRHETYAVLTLAGDDEDQRRAGLDEIHADLHADGLEVQVGGGVAINRDINEMVSSDIGRAEAISLPILGVLLVIIFGSIASAGLPLANGGVAILGAFTALRGFATFTDVSIFAVNVVTIIGLGLAIDYGLFMVSRFREEMRKTASVEDALARTMATAGRTVAVSGVTVAISLAGLMIFPQVFLRSMGFGGVSAVLIAMLAALTLLPALLAMLGPKVDAWSVRPWLRRLFRRSPAAAGGESGAWARIAHAVMRRPVLITVVVAGVLIALALPFLRVEFGGVDHRALPEGTESRVVSERLLTDFPGGGTTTVDAVASFADGSIDAGDRAALGRYVDRVAALPGVTSAEVTATDGGTALVQVRHSFEGVSSQARELVGEVRAVPDPAGAEVLVGGRAADLRDLLANLGATLPWMGLFVVGVTLVLLFLAFGSVVLPVKAVLMNVLSLSASFGAVVWIFQEGHLSSLLGFTSTGAVEATQPILMLAMAFGLSMDYEVFLLSRVREEWDRTGNNAQAVAAGLQKSGRIITSAAGLLVVVIGAFATSGIVFIKMIGVGMVIAILIDATVVRALLVPATMRLLGRWNWWAPAPLARFWARHGIRETDALVSLPEQSRPAREPVAP